MEGKEKGNISQKAGEKQEKESKRYVSLSNQESGKTAESRNRQRDECKR